MIYADMDFFLTLLKEKDWLKEKAKKTLKEYEGQMTMSIVTFIELAFFAKKYDLDVVKLFTSVMAIEDVRILKAAIYIRDHGLSVFDAFHTAYCAGKIISSDSVYDKVGIGNQIGSGLKEIER